ncbi:3-oxoadipate enol-lactonase [Tistlia consotensis]|uniref:3-oxoadipate enol-lactonase n=1 Tax=Tistlia consotensis USBA 355 TaxID=560819 RepID=A0A1Y6BN41_9PROT|nr:alpha/beta fold hydrolase [Tistlia consotensis]SMF20713.1 3-oxoadipate enol-lactonase [Tistlia consotensis USBA 355]SNR47634.1 3-oxoadipate enol-lactonase [Tistlia consotensis]
MSQVRQIEANGLSQCVEIAGPADAPAVVLSHSLACSRAMWRPQIEALAKDHLVVAYDTRGHGGTAAPDGPYDLELLAADLLGLAEALTLPRFHFVGLSMGGMIGQQLALTAPGKLISLTLCATTSRIPPEGRKAFDERIAAAESQGMAALAEATLARWFTEPFRAAGRPEVEAIRQLILATPVAGFVGCCRAIQPLDLTDRLPAVRTPTLVLAGQDDPGMPPAVMQTIKEQIPGAQLCVLAHAAHLLNVEQAETTSGLLRSFIGAHGRG